MYSLILINIMVTTMKIVFVFILFFENMNSLLFITNDQKVTATCIT